MKLSLEKILLSALLIILTCGRKIRKQKIVTWDYDQNPYIKSEDDYVFSKKKDFPCAKCEHYCTDGNGFGAKCCNINWCIEKCTEKCTGNWNPQIPSTIDDK